MAADSPSNLPICSLARRGCPQELAFAPVPGQSSTPRRGAVRMQYYVRLPLAVQGETDGRGCSPTGRRPGNPVLAYRPADRGDGRGRTCSDDERLAPARRGAPIDAGGRASE